MTYHQLERILKNASAKAFGISERSKQEFITRDPNAGIDLSGLDIGACVELSFPMGAPPFPALSAQVLLYATSENNDASLHMLFGERCYDVEGALRLASTLLNDHSLSSWRIESITDELSPLHISTYFPSHLNVDDELFSAFYKRLKQVFDLCKADPFLSLIKKYTVKED